MAALNTRISFFFNFIIIFPLVCENRRVFSKDNLLSLIYNISCFSLNFLVIVYSLVRENRGVFKLDSHISISYLYYKFKCLAFSPLRL